VHVLSQRAGFLRHVIPALYYVYREFKFLQTTAITIQIYSEAAGSGCELRRSGIELRQFLAVIFASTFDKLISLTTERKNKHRGPFQREGTGEIILIEAYLSTSVCGLAIPKSSP
jgi:hypothetical protein